jgi:hypothetical protein
VDVTSNETQALFYTVKEVRLNSELKKILARKISPSLSQDI